MFTPVSHSIESLIYILSLYCCTIALTPTDIRRLLRPAFARATELKSQFDEPESVDNMPFVVTVCVCLFNLIDVLITIFVSDFF